MRERLFLWGAMGNRTTALSTLIKHYLITCETEGKTPSTLRGYREKLGRFTRWSEGTGLKEFTVELARRYIGYLQTVPRYHDHPFRQPDGTRMSATNVRNHVRVLKGFSSWLYREGYTSENVLLRVRPPKASPITTLVAGVWLLLVTVPPHARVGFTPAGRESGQDCDGAYGQAPMKSLLTWSVGMVRHLENESTDHIKGIAPVPLRVRPEPIRPG